MNRPSIVLAASLAISSLSIGCASAPKPFPESRGAPIGPGMTSFESLGIESRAESDERDRAWEPNFLYPPLEAPEQRAADDRSRPEPVRRALRAGELEGDIRARGPGRASMYLFFRAFKETYSRVDGSYCTFVPSCSRFGLEAVRELGPLGFPLTLGRLTRSHTHERDFYRPADIPIFRRDPVDNYTFWLRDDLRPDDFDSYEDPAHAWFNHLRMLEDYERPEPPSR
jgi:putative component of membrane protein insertase Oxa1/YidC/SpoIIIJ protein YidD